MKRRDFLAKSLFAAGVPLAGLARATPCPPSTVALAGGASASTACGGSAAADWQSRTSAAGVVWYHDFQAASEVNAFRWTSGYGNDPNDAGMPGYCIWDSTDGITGGCLKITHPAGTNDPPHWWRPFSPVRAPGNGKTTDDPGAGIVLKPYAATDGGNQIYNWQGGYYGHHDYWAANPTYFDGDVFYLQIRLKPDPTCTDDGIDQVGKMFWITTTRNTSTTQQLVTYSNASYSGAAQPRPNYHDIYQGIGYQNLATYAGAPGTTTEYGSALGNASTGQWCDYYHGNVGRCWAYSGGWDTLLYEIHAGHSGTNDTILRCYAAHQGETSYTKIWDLTYAAGFDDNDSYLKNGWNAVTLATYVNGFQGISLAHSIYHKFAQVILSKSFIACPQV